MTTMRPRERATAALHHQEPDRVPLDIGGGASTSLVVEAHDKLKQHWGITAPERIISKSFRVARLDEETMRRLGSDFRPITLKAPRNWAPPPSEPGTFVDELGVKWRQAHYAGGYYWELAQCPLADATIADLESYPWPDPDDPGRYVGLAEEIKDLYNNTPYALVGDGGFKGFWEPAFMLRGLTQALMDLVQNKEFMHALLGKLLEINTAVAKRFLEIVGPYVTVVRTADDLATQKSLLMSPATYREMIQPYQKKLNQTLKQYTDAILFYHSCGNVTSLVGDLIDSGVEALNPVQVTAIPDPAGLKAKYGDRLCFWGAIDTQHVLPHGTPEDVRQEVRLRLRQLGQGGGYVVAGVHNLQPDVPPQNIIAMAEAAREFGAYPLQ